MKRTIVIAALMIAGLQAGVVQAAEPLANEAGHSAPPAKRAPASSAHTHSAQAANWDFASGHDAAGEAVPRS